MAVSDKLSPASLRIVGGNVITLPMAGGSNVPEDSTPLPRAPADIEGLANWQAIARSNEFRALLRAKRRFIIPALIVFVVYYFALPVLVGYARPFMERRVIGSVNIAYLFALSQFFMAWIIAALYVRAAARFDKMAKEILDRQRR